jgi:uncharacterized cysteine cluster protein YcgN (CxxCxxCC family)
MDDPTPRSNLRPRYWERVKLKDMTPREWEALCDGCGKCCLNKLEDPDTGEVALTRLACRLFDDGSCRCGNYEIRKQIVPECVVLSARTIARHAYWMPETCAYRLLHEGKRLPAWHPLITGRPESVFEAGVSAQGITIPEYEVEEDDWEDYIIEEPI